MSKLVFSDYMNGLSTERISEKRAMIRKIADATLKDEGTVYAWIRGDQTPDALTKKVISGVLNIPVEELFPEAS